MNTRPEISIVVPVLNESLLIEDFATSLIPILREVTPDFEILFVDDGSTDRTWEEIASLAQRFGFIRGVRLVRNYGKEIALYAGLAEAKGAAHIPMDVDFQDPPEVIPELVTRWREGAKQVIPFREKRSDNRVRAFLSKKFHHTIENLSDGTIRSDIGDFRLLDKSVTERFLQMKEVRRYNKGMFMEAGGDPDYVPFSRPKSTRKGRPTQSLDNLLDLSQVALFQNSGRLLRWIAMVSGLAAVGSAGLIPVVIVMWLTGLIVVPGQATVIVIGLLIFSIQVFTFSLLALFIGDIAVEVNGRPLYFVEEQV